MEFPIKGLSEEKIDLYLGDTPPHSYDTVGVVKWADNPCVEVERRRVLLKVGVTCKGESEYRGYACFSSPGKAREVASALMEHADWLEGI